MKAHVAEAIKTRPASKIVDSEGRSFVITMPCRLQWPSLHEVSGPKDATKLKYSAALIIPVQCDIKPLIDLGKERVAEKFAGKTSGLRNPLRKQDEKSTIDNAGFGDSGYWFTASANENYPPMLVGPDLKPISRTNAQTMFYPGCWVVAKINAFSYDKTGNRGVAFGLIALQKLFDDERLATGGASNHIAEFMAVQGYTDTSSEPSSDPFAAAPGEWN